MICQFCKKDFKEEETYEHHLLPRFMNNPKGLGKKIYLCEKCHNILHLKIPSLFWILLSEEQQKDTIKIIVQYTEKQIKKGGNYD